jgi:hypothetical protein
MSWPPGKASHEVSAGFLAQGVAERGPEDGSCARTRLGAPSVFLEKHLGESRKQRLISRDHLNPRSSEARSGPRMAGGVQGTLFIGGSET